MSGRKDPIGAMAAEIALHQRLDPMASRDRCTCGYMVELGVLFTQHIAEALSYIPGVLRTGDKQ